METQKEVTQSELKEEVQARVVEDMLKHIPDIYKEVIRDAFKVGDISAGWLDDLRLSHVAISH